MLYTFSFTCNTLLTQCRTEPKVWTAFSDFWHRTGPKKIKRKSPCSRNLSTTSKHQASPSSSKSLAKSLFIQPFHPSAPLRSSDRRKLKFRVLQSFSLSPDAVDSNGENVGDVLVPDGILS